VMVWFVSTAALAIACFLAYTPQNSCWVLGFGIFFAIADVIALCQLVCRCRHWN